MEGDRPPPRAHRVVLEACVTTPEEARAAVRGGADRLELCRELDAGGLTPSPDLLAACRTVLAEEGRGEVPIHCMVRSRPGDFQVDAPTLETMLRDAEALLVQGADGLVMGAVDANGRVDLRTTGALLTAADGAPVTFHRAFDGVPDRLEALHVLRELGVARILTAGGPGRAVDQSLELRGLVAASRTLEGQRPVILGAGGVRGDHAAELIRETGLLELHARASAFPELGRALRSAT